MFCPKCGAQQPDGARFCAACGSPFASAGAPQGAPSQTPFGQQPYSQPSPFATQPMAAPAGISTNAIVGIVAAVAALFFLNLPWVTVTFYGSSQDIKISEIMELTGYLSSASSYLSSSDQATANLTIFVINLVNALMIASMVGCVASIATRVAALVPSPAVQAYAAKVPGVLHLAVGAAAAAAAAIWVVVVFVASSEAGGYLSPSIGCLLTLVAGVIMAVTARR